MATSQPKDIYPGERTLTETARLRAQHDLLSSGLGGFLLAPLDKDKSDLRVLDIGSADGYFLQCMRQTMSQSASASATFIGTDIGTYPFPEEHEGIEMVKHDFRTPFPDDWQLSFDFVGMRACLASISADKSVDLLEREIRLLRPGGWIQIVDGSMQTGPLEANDRPSTKLWKIVGNFLSEHGMDATSGQHVDELLRKAGAKTLTNFGAKAAAGRFGKGSMVEEQSWDWLRGQFSVLGPALARMEKPLISEEAWKQLKVDVLQEAKNEGFDLPWYAAWAQKL